MKRWVVGGITGGVILVAVALSTWQACRQDAQRPTARTVDVHYRFTVREIPAGAAAIAAWVPVPRSNECQRLESFRIEEEWPRALLVEPEYGNRFLRIDLSGGRARGAREMDVAVAFRVERSSCEGPGGANGPEAASPAVLSRFLAPDRLVPIDGTIAAEARRVAGAAVDPLARARRLYDHVVSTVVYDKSGDGWGRGDARYACDVRAGNCTDFHSLFIGEARSLGIPARFVMGLPLPEGVPEGAIPGYHCWAEFYVDGRGWVPLDASEAGKDPERLNELFGRLDANRVEFTVGRDIRIPEAAAGPFNYVIYPHVEIDGSPYANVETRFSFRGVRES